MGDKGDVEFLLSVFRGLTVQGVAARCARSKTMAVPDQELGGDVKDSQQLC